MFSFIWVSPTDLILDWLKTQIQMTNQIKPLQIKDALNRPDPDSKLESKRITEA